MSKTESEPNEDDESLEDDEEQYDLFADFFKGLVGPDEVRHNISESADKIRLKTKIKRGSDTRDQDEIEVTVKGNDPEETADRLHQTVVEIGENGTHNALRGTQPDTADD